MFTDIFIHSMALHRLFQLSSLLRSAVSVTLRRNIGISAVLFNKGKDMDPVQKLFLDKIRDYTTKSKYGPVSHLLKHILLREKLIGVVGRALESIQSFYLCRAVIPWK